MEQKEFDFGEKRLIKETVVKYYEEKGIISKIDGMKRVNEVYAEITKIIS